MQLSNREKQLIWRSLCESEEIEKKRIAGISSECKKFNEKAKEKMIKTGRERLKEIKEIKEKMWN